MSAAKLIVGLAVTLVLPGIAWAATPDSRRLAGCGKTVFEPSSGHLDEPNRALYAVLI